MLKQRRPFGTLAAFAMLLATPAFGQAPSGTNGEAASAVPDAAKIDISWAGIRLRDGIKLNAITYLPRDQKAPAPCIFTMTPYTAQGNQDRGVYFAAHGLPFVAVDVRGRGDSEGEFRPFIQEAQDGHDIAEWLAKQPFCNRKVSMWGGSYAGYSQWATAKEGAPHLSTIVPVAAPYAGADFPFRNNVAAPYLMQWLTFTSGRTSQASIFGDSAFWNSLWKRRFEEGVAFNTLPTIFGGDQKVLREFIAHPQVGAWHDSYSPTAEQFRALDMPILTITGSYDGAQPGALAYYNAHMRFAAAAQRDKHYLVIGPWDHLGTRTPQAKFGGLTFGPESLVDLPQLHLDWYRWAMADGTKPAFLKKRVAYYVMGAERWRYADTLEAVTSEERPYYLGSVANATRVMGSGSLSIKPPVGGSADSYVYDPRDVSSAKLEANAGPSWLTDQKMVLAGDGKQLVYHTEAFEQDTELSGFFRLSAWIAIDQPDTDFQVSVYEIDGDGQSILLTNDIMRARYRESLREAKLITTVEPLKYEFNRFSFVSRRVAKGSRLRLVIGPINSMHMQKNYNSGGVVSDENLSNARAVKVKLLHGMQHQSALYVPIGTIE